MGLDTVTPTQAGLAVLAVTLAPAMLVLLASGLSNLSVRYWRSRVADSDDANRETRP